MEDIFGPLPWHDASVALHEIRDDFDFLPNSLLLLWWSPRSLRHFTLFSSAGLSSIRLFVCLSVVVLPLSRPIPASFSRPVHISLSGSSNPTTPSFHLLVPIFFDPPPKNSFLVFFFLESSPFFHTDKGTRRFHFSACFPLSYIFFHTFLLIYTQPSILPPIPA